MKIVFVGASPTAVTTARQLIDHGHEVVMIERDQSRIEAVSEDLDCGFLLGDGTRPDVLKQAGPDATDILLCLAGMDQENILASLVGQAFGIPRVITKLEDPEFEAVAVALGLKSVVVPVRTVGRRLADLVEGKDTLELSSLIKNEAALFSFIVRPAQAGPSKDLGLPDDARIVWLYRNDTLHFAEPEPELLEGDEVVILTRSERAGELHDRLVSASGGRS